MLTVSNAAVIIESMSCEMKKSTVWRVWHERKYDLRTQEDHKYPPRLSSHDQDETKNSPTTRRKKL